MESLLSVDAEPLLEVLWRCSIDDCPVENRTLWIGAEPGTYAAAGRRRWYLGHVFRRRT